MEIDSEPQKTNRVTKGEGEVLMEALFLSCSAIISNKTYITIGSAPITASLLSQGL